MDRLLREPEWKPFLREEVIAADKFRATQAYKTHREAYDNKSATPAASTPKPHQTQPAEHQAGDGKETPAGSDARSPPASTLKPHQTHSAEHQVGDRNETPARSDAKESSIITTAAPITTATPITTAAPIATPTVTPGIQLQNDCPLPPNDDDDQDMAQPSRSDRVARSPQNPSLGRGLS